MSRKNTLVPTQIITSGAMTGTAVVTSSEVEISYLDNVGVQLVWTGTAVGTFVIEATIDGSTWRAIDLPTISASGSASDHLISLNQLPFKRVRVKYTNASSTGTLQAYAMGKEA